MEKYLFLPMAAYVFYIWAIAHYSLRTRVRAIRSKQVSISHFKGFQGQSTERVTIVGRHYDNQFQLPLLFLVTCLTCLTTKNVEILTVILAWLFLVVRMGHTYEHLGRNNVIRRATWFGAGWLVIGMMWILLLKNFFEASVVD